MKEHIETVRAFYNQGAAGEWARLEKHPFEFLLTTWMMDRYIRPGDTVLDIGGGPGRYSIYFAEKGCAVTLAELSEGNAAFAREKAAEAGAAVRAKKVTTKNEVSSSFFMEPPHGPDLDEIAKVCYYTYKCPSWKYRADFS